eukprot:sb/3474593/
MRKKGGARLLVANDLSASIKPKFQFFQLIEAQEHCVKISEPLELRCPRNLRFQTLPFYWTTRYILRKGSSSRTLCQNFRTIGIKVPEKSKISDPPFLLDHTVHSKKGKREAKIIIPNLLVVELSCGSEDTYDVWF